MDMFFTWYKRRNPDGEDAAQACEHLQAQSYSIEQMRGFSTRKWKEQGIQTGLGDRLHVEAKIFMKELEKGHIKGLEGVENAYTHRNGEGRGHEGLDALLRAANSLQ